MKQSINIENINYLLNQINDTVTEAHPDPEDETGLIVWNACLAIAEELGVQWP